MKTRSTPLLFAVAVSLGLWLETPAPSAASALTPVTHPALQTGSSGWILWETETPVQRLALDGDTLWVGHDKAGLNRWDLAAGLEATYSSADGLSGEDVLSIAVDGSGDVWLALLDGGVDRTSNGSSFDDLTPPQAANVHPWALDANGGDIWLGTLGAGVAQRAGGSWTAYTTANSNLPFDDIYAVGSRGAEVWVGTIGYGVAAFSSVQLPEPRERCEHLTPIGFWVPAYAMRPRSPTSFVVLPKPR